MSWQAPTPDPWKGARWTPRAPGPWDAFAADVHPYRTPQPPVAKRTHRAAGALRVPLALRASLGVRVV